MIEPQMDYGFDPCMVKRLGGHVVTSRPCIGNIKVLQTLFALSFASKVLAGLRVALHGFHGGRESCSSASLLQNFGLKLL